MSGVLGRVLADSSSAVAAYTASGARTRRDFSAAASHVARYLRERDVASCILTTEDAWHFATAFFGCLAAGKLAVIPPNFLPTTLLALRGAGDTVLDDAAIAALGTGVPEALTIPHDASIELYTSGSAGEPTRASKQLCQLDAEVAVLEAMFGAHLGGAVVLGTVPHHHIYGLLFRLLWPLGAGRPFVSGICAEPHTLCATLEKHRRCVLVSSPAHLSRLAQPADAAAYRDRIAEVFSSGGPLGASDALAVADTLGRAPVEVYGSTESGGIGWRRQTESPEWTPLQRVSLALDDAGALVVCSPFAAPDAAPLTVADAAEILADGRFRLLGRLDRIVKIEEKRVSLVALEEKLRDHPWVRDAATVLLASRRNMVGAAAVLEPEGFRALRDGGREAVVGALRAHLAQYVESVALPRRWRFPDTLPYNDRGKLARSHVAALFELPAA